MCFLMHCEGNITYLVFLPKLFTLTLNIKKQSDKTKLRSILKITGLDSSKNVSVLKEPPTSKKEILLDYKRLQKQENQMCYTMITD